MPTDKRQRQKEARLARLEAERRAAKQAATRKRAITFGVIAVLVLGALFAISTLGGDDDDETDVASDGAPTTFEFTDREGETVEVDLPAETPTELETSDLREGDGAEAKLGDSVTVDYIGVLAKDGTEFDGSFDGAEPVTFQLVEGGLIEGWTEGIPGMKVGGRRVLVIPAEQAYGEAGSPPNIGPNEPLVFVVDLVDVAAAETPATTDTTAPATTDTTAPAE